MKLPTVISSMNNIQIKNLTLLQKKAKARKEQGLFVVEGIKMFQEARESGLLLKPICLKVFIKICLINLSFLGGLNLNW